MCHTVCLGVGNTLLSDEGAGVHAMRMLEARRQWAGDVEFIDAGTLSFTLADAIARADNLIIFDAAQLDGTPGHVDVLEGAAFDGFLKSGKRSVHEVGFADLMDIARLQESLPSRRALIGIQPGDFGWGDRPGAAVSAALPAACDLAERLIDDWAGRDVTEAVTP